MHVKDAVCRLRRPSRSTRKSFSAPITRRARFGLADTTDMEDTFGEYQESNLQPKLQFRWSLLAGLEVFVKRCTVEITV